MKAVFWDYDGTIVDTRLKNYHVTKNIIQDVTHGKADDYPFLQSFENYKKGIVHITNWRDIYIKHFGFSDETTDRVGRMWNDYQAANQTVAPLFPGIDLIIRQFEHLPQAIISQNASGNIRNSLAVYDLESFFSEIIGYEEVDIRLQKPHPGGLFTCIERMKLYGNQTIFYIGDHESDVQLVRNANSTMQSKNPDLKILSIAVRYDHDQNPDQWQYRPDFTVSSADQIAAIVTTVD